MTKLAGDHVRVLVDGYELSGDSNRISINDSRDLFDVTTFGDEVHKFIPGQRLMALRHAGFMNSADAGSHPVLQGADVDGLFSVYIGQNTEPSAGDPVFSLLTQQGRYGALPQTNRMIPFQAVFANRGEYGGWGVALGVPNDGYNPAGGVLNSNVTSGQGGLACLHVLSTTSTGSYTIEVQGAPTGDFRSGQQRTLATFSLDGTALGSELVPISGTIARHLLWRATRQGPSEDMIKVAISLIRH